MRHWVYYRSLFGCLYPLFSHAGDSARMRSQVLCHRATAASPRSITCFSATTALPHSITCASFLCWHSAASPSLAPHHLWCITCPKYISGFEISYSPVTLGSIVAPTQCIGITVRSLLSNTHLHCPIGPNGCSHVGTFPTMRSQVLCRRATAASNYLAGCASFSRRIPFTHYTPRPWCLTTVFGCPLYMQASWHIRAYVRLNVVRNTQPITPYVSINHLCLVRILGFIAHFMRL